jgi:hypothetical protein
MKKLNNLAHPQKHLYYKNLFMKLLTSNEQKVRQKAAEALKEFELGDEINGLVKELL